jgi:hypothetical protein
MGSIYLEPFMNVRYLSHVVKLQVKLTTIFAMLLLPESNALPLGHG